MSRNAIWIEFNSGSNGYSDPVLIENVDENSTVSELKKSIEEKMSIKVDVQKLYCFNDPINENCKWCKALHELGR